MTARPTYPFHPALPRWLMLVLAGLVGAGVAVVGIALWMAVLPWLDQRWAEVGWWP